MAIAVIVVVFALVALFLQTEWGRAYVEGLAVREIQALLTDEAEFEVRRVEGNFLTGARMLDARVLLDRETVAQIDTLYVRYNLFTLLQRTFSASEVYAGSVRLWARQDTEGDWNIARIFRPVEHRPDVEPWTIRLGRLTLRDGLAEFHFHNPVRDSILIADAVNFQMTKFLSDPNGVEARLEMLLTRVYPAVLDPVPIDVTFTGNLEGQSLLVERLLLTSERSDVTLVGRLDWRDTFTWDADLLAQPLDLADLRQFFDLPLYGTANTRIHSIGDVDNFAAAVRADFVDQGAFHLRGNISTARVGDARYAISGSLSQFDAGRFFGSPDFAANLTGTLAVDLHGPSPEEFSGPVNVSLRGSSFQEQQITQADLVGRFDRGSLTFDVDADVPGADLVARGTVRPFDDVIPYDVRGEAWNVHLGTLLRDPEMDIAMRRATFRFDGRGLEMETLETDYSIAAEGFRIDDLEFASARAAGNLRRGLLSFDAGVVVPDGGGSITGVGTARPFDEPLVFNIRRGTFSGVDLAVLTGDPGQASNLSGTYSASGVGTDPETMRLDFSLSLSPSRYAHLDITSAEATGTLRAGELALDLAADLAEAGALTAEGTISPFVEPAPFSFSGRMDNLDLAVLLQDPGQRSDLTWTYSITGRGLDPETMVAEFVIDLEPSRYVDQQLIAGRIDGRLDSGLLVATIDAEVPEGRFAFTLTLRPFIDEPTVQITDARLIGFDISAFIDIPFLDTDLQATIFANLTGLDPATASGSGSIILDRSRINAAIIESGRIDFQLDRGHVTAIVQLDFDQGQAALAFQGRPFDDVPTYAIDGRTEDVDVVALLGDRRGLSDVTMEFAITGVGTDPETMDARAQVTMIDSRLPEARVDRLVADVALTDGVLIAEAFDLRADFADITAHGQIALFNRQATTDLVVDADIRDAGPLDALTPADLFVEAAEIDGRFLGVPGEPIAFDGSVAARHVIYGDIGVRRFDARINAQLQPEEDIPFEGRARVRFEFLSLPTFNIRDGDVRLDYFGEELVAEGSLTIDDERDLQFRTRTEVIEDPLGPYHTRLLIDQLNVRFDEQLWALLQPASLSIGHDRYLIRNLLLESNGQQIAADGEIDLAGEQTLLVTLEDVQIDPWSDLIGYRHLGGVLSTVLSVEGPAASPIIHASVQIEDLTTEGEPVGALDATFAYANEVMDVQAELTHVGGETFRAEGFFPLALRIDQVPAEPSPDAPISFVLTSEGFPIAWAEPFIPPGMVTEIGGRLTADVTVGGTYGSPVLDGTLRVEDGRLQMETTGDVVFQDIVMAFELEGNAARIVEARVHDGRGGVMHIEGDITLPELAVGELNLLLLPTEFRAIETDTYRGLTFTATRSDNLRFQGTITEPVLTGNVTLVSGDIYLTEELMGPDLVPVELTDAEIHRIEATFGIRVDEVDRPASPFIDLLDLDISVIVERNVWIRSRQDPRFDVEFFGTISIIKPPEVDFEFFGSLEVIRGRLEMPTLVRRRFEVGSGLPGTYGTLVFNGPLDESVINLRAGLQARAGTGADVAATIYVEIEGLIAEGPDFRLTSDPAMDPSDIACVIATGRPCGEAFNPNIAEDIAVAQLGLLIETIAARQLGLDVVEVQRRPTGELVITFGTYVGDRTYVAISQPLTEARVRREQTGMLPEVLIEYALLRWLLLRLEHRNVGGVGGSVFIQFDY